MGNLASYSLENLTVFSFSYGSVSPAAQVPYGALR